MPDLLQLQSQKIATKPFLFQLTNIKVFSLEEAIYHSFLYPRESMEDIISDIFIDFVKNELELPRMATQMEALLLLPSMTEKLSLFFSFTSQITTAQQAAVISDMAKWENRQEWEKLLDRGNLYMTNNHYYTGAYMYEKALLLTNHPQIHHNMAIALMHIRSFDEAVLHAKKALSIGKENGEKKNFLEIVSFTLVEALIYQGAYKEAREIIDDLYHLVDNKWQLHFFSSLLLEAQGDILGAINVLESVHIAKPGADKMMIIKQLASLYVAARQYDKALDLVENTLEKPMDFYLLEADIYATMSHFPAAMVATESAIAMEPANPLLWLRLATYLRKQYETEKALTSILKAHQLDGSNKSILLEWAKILKAQGKLKEYQAMLASLLHGFTWEYRQMFELHTPEIKP